MQHHARLFVANALTEADLEDYLFIAGEDIVHIIRDKLRIDDVKDIKKYAYQKPIKRQYVDIVVFADVYLQEAQNALLKLLEEPPTSTRFTLVVRDAQQLLVTVRSRLFFSVSEANINSDSEEVGLSFLQNTVAERISTIDSLAKNKDTKSMKKIIYHCAPFVNEVSQSDKKTTAINYRTIITSLQYSQQNGASLKMLLEYVALMMPVMKTK